MVMRVPALLLWLLQLPGYKYWLFKRINVLQISLATVQCILIVISFVEIGKKNTSKFRLLEFVLLK